MWVFRGTSRHVDVFSGGEGLNVDPLPVHRAGPADRPAPVRRYAGPAHHRE